MFEDNFKEYYSNSVYSMGRCLLFIKDNFKKSYQTLYLLSDVKICLTLKFPSRFL